MLPRTIVSVLDSSDVVKDVAVAWALSLARWYESDLHVVHVRRSVAARLPSRVLDAMNSSSASLASQRPNCCSESCSRPLRRSD